MVVAERGPRGAAKRPRDRKAQFAEAAAALFREQGYHRVGIEDIATSVGITGRAIYRHFGNKHDLLANVSGLVDAGTLKTTLGEHFGRITAENLTRAHAFVESGKAIGKVVLEGF